MSGARSTGSTTYTVDDSTTQSETVVNEQSATVTSTISATTQVADYFLDGLREFARKTHLDLAIELGASDYAGDPDLFLPLISADVEQLLEHRLITAVYLVLWEPAAGENGDNIYKVRYRAIYRVGRNLENAQPERLGDALEPPRALGAQTRFSLLVDWTPRSEERRESALLSDTYNFLWRPIRAAAFDTSHLTDPARYGGLTTTGDLRVTRVEQYTPADLRRLRQPSS